MRNFNGVNDHLDAGNPSALNLTADEVTLSAWIRLATVNGEGKILAKWADAGSLFQYLLSVDSDNKCLFATFSGVTRIALGTTTLLQGIFYNLIGVYDGAVMRNYCNSIEEDSISASGNMPSTTAPVRIGAGSGGAGTEDPFDGDIGHCTIYDKALSPSEVQALFHAGPLHIPLGISYWPINGQSPELDVIGGHNMTVNGTTVTDEPPIPNSIVAP